MEVEKIETKEDLENIFKQHRDIVYRSILFKVCMNREIAEDLSQETFIRAWKYKHSFNYKKSKLQTWLVTIARNVCNDHFKSTKYKILDIEDFEDSLNSDEDIQKLIHEDILKQKILTSISLLSTRDRELLSLRYIEELDLKEIAQITKKSYLVTKVAMNRAFSKLKKLINSEK